MELVYNIKREELYAIKIPNDYRANELLQREIYNFSQINHPFIIKCFGTVKKNEKNCLIIQYIHGRTLYDIDSDFLNENELYTAIFEIIVA